MDPRRWTPLVFLAPWRFVDPDEFRDFDLEAWSDRGYEWTEDPWNGFVDFAQRPTETVSRETGDCEDYALLAASWAIAQGRDGVGLAFCWESPKPWPTHAIAFDDERVYSSGRIRDVGVDEWLAESTYSFAVRRRIRIDSG